MMQVLQIKSEKLIGGYNPRKHFDIDDLKRSIEQQGLLVPLLVRPQGEKYQIISGECRWRACKELHIAEISCVVREMSDEESANIAYIDNKQRNNLSPIDEAKHFAYMRDKYGYSAQTLADRYGVSKSRVIEYWAISELPNFGPTSDRLTKNHLYELSKLVNKNDLIKVFEEGFDISKEEWDNDQKKQYSAELKIREEEQIKLASIIIESELSVKQTEREVKNILYRFAERDKQIKLKEKEKVVCAIKKIKDGVSEISGTVVRFKDGMKDFSNIATMFSPSFFEKVNENDKDELHSELVELYEEIDTMNNEELKKEVRYFLSHLGGKKNEI